MISNYCVCRKLLVGPKTVVSGMTHHSRNKCVEYEERDGKRAVVKMVSTEPVAISRPVEGPKA